MKQDPYQSVENRGFAVIPHVLANSDIDTLLGELSSSSVRRSRAGIRHALGIEAVATIAGDKRLLELANSVLGDEVIPFRATMFDKSPTSNWLVVWHQDTALPLCRRYEIREWGPWSIKDGVTYAHAPATALERVVALRIHLDESGAKNGPLRVLPGTHRLGVLTDDEIQGLSERIRGIDCIVPRGGVLMMRPLLVHASSKSTSTLPRRILHIEYSRSRFVGDGIELAIC